MRANKSEKRIKRHLYSMIFLSILFITLFYYIHEKEDYYKTEILDLEHIKYDVSEAVYFMEKATDQTALFIKEYVITGDVEYLDLYYQDIYMHKHSIQSVDLIYDIEILSSARRNLEKAQLYITELRDYETEAINYMKAGYQEDAEDILFSSDYGEYKNLIYDSVDKFNTESTEIVDNEITKAEATFETYILYSYALLIAFISIILIITYFIYKNQKDTTERILLDPLTKVGNHQALNEYISYDYNKFLSCIVIDLIAFKFINDMYGYKNGDNALIEIAKRLVKKYSKKHVYRISGNRFIVLIKRKVKENELKDIISLVTRPIKNQNNYGDIVVNCSIGVASKELKIRNIEEIVDIASLASIISKDKNKNSYTYADKETVNQFNERMVMNDKLDKAIIDGSIYPEYQIIINPHNDTVVGMESLAKWNKDGDILDSVELYEYCKKYGFIFDCDITILHTALKDLSRLMINGQVPNDFFVSISFSHFSLLRLDIKEILYLIHDLELKPSNIQLEISNKVLENIDSLDVVNELSSLGFRIVIESIDFDLTRINDLPNIGLGLKDIIKYSIKENEVFYEMLLEITNKLNINVNVKGVSKLRELSSALKFKNVNVQGLYFSKPLDIDHFEILLSKINKGIAKLTINH